MKALIAGAHGDIGHAALHYLLENNYSVTALDRKMDRLKQINPFKKLKTMQIDFRDSLQLEYYLNELKQPFDVVIYSAGVREIVPAIELSLTRWREINDVNLTGAFIFSKCAAKLAIKHNHPLCIIYISSVSGLQGEPQRSAYCASKHGLIGLTKSLAIELAPHAIRVNAIAPGIIETDLTRPYQQISQTMEKINRNIPLTRWGQPQHITQTIDFIIKNDYVTGSTLVVDGGWTSGKTL